MRRVRFRWAALVGALALGLKVVAAPDPADRQLFEQVKARAEKGDAQAQLQLGAMYARGEGVAKDLSKAAKWHRKAAESGLAYAQLTLSLDYAYGRGVKPDALESVRWLRKAANQDLAEAQFDLGLAYANGEGVSQNSAEAVRWFRLAAAQGLADAYYELGRSYFDGTGVPTDINQAMIWTRKAAQQGLPAAQNRLANCYVKGEGVTTNYVEAYKWFSLAAAQDDNLASDIHVSLAKIKPLMTSEQITEAQRLAGEFKPGPNTTASSTNAAPVTAETAPPAAASAATGSVNVLATDEQCEVFVDGAFIGNTPARLKLAAGPHVIEVKKAGLKDYRRELSVTAGSDLTVRADLSHP